jgi:hypothetical protein
MSCQVTRTITYERWTDYIFEKRIISVLHCREFFFISALYDQNVEVHVVSFNQCQVKTPVRALIQGELTIFEKRIIDHFTIAWQRVVFLSLCWIIKTADYFVCCVRVVSTYLRETDNHRFQIMTRYLQRVENWILSKGRKTNNVSN